MERGNLEALAQFCVAQRQAFSVGDWLERCAREGAAVAFAAKYLSMTSWYGHELELEQIVAETDGLLAGKSQMLHLEAQHLGFDLFQFSAAVRLGIALLLVRSAARQPPAFRRGGIFEETP